MSNSGVRLLVSLKNYLKELFNLSEGKERDEITIQEIKKGVEFKGTNLWILIFAIFIASIGLNVNSAAVVIGAMLISPLMGPIMGVGMGAAINDFELIKKAFKNLGVAVLISVLTSALYFFITPLHEAQSELLARTQPTLWDVLIALFGGLSGIVAGSRREKSNAIPGVAIATALMPPLCTAGYGLANGNWYYFAGAFYLFFINSVFISVSTFVIVRFLKYPRKHYESEVTERRVKTLIWIFVFITAVPSIYLAYNLVRKTIFEQNARNFVNTEFHFDDTQVISENFSFDNNKATIDVTLYGRPLSEEEIADIEKDLAHFNLAGAELKIRQGYKEETDAVEKAEFEKMSEALKVDLLKDIYEKNEEIIKSKDDKIIILENQIRKFQSKVYPVADIKAELEIQYPTLENISMGDMINNDQDTLCYAVLDFKKIPYRSDQKKIRDWLNVRTKADSLIVVIQ
ncbi:TIGR00341 family protein [Fulvivirga lutea]|uniref:TIGR00341 family protein n=1 Tax=Fulvivirga lutea TaxID=2810512 RepID=A0A974WGP7_9BACT|nr:TIGR00341 family protein [Fulvivirga lutea]QSE98188.1 TIGR00341 family protein [Fulvivirga lutea]